MMSRSKWLPLKSITVGSPPQKRQGIVHETELGKILRQNPRKYQDRSVGPGPGRFVRARPECKLYFRDGLPSIRKRPPRRNLPHMSETTRSDQAQAPPLSSPQDAARRLAELSVKTRKLLQNNLQNFGTIWSGPLDQAPVWTAFADLSGRLASDPLSSTSAAQPLAGICRTLVANGQA